MFCEIIFLIAHNRTVKDYNITTLTPEIKKYVTSNYVSLDTLGPINISKFFILWQVR